MAVYFQRLENRYLEDLAELTDGEIDFLLFHSVIASSKFKYSVASKFESCDFC